MILINSVFTLILLIGLVNVNSDGDVNESSLWDYIGQRLLMVTTTTNSIGRNLIMYDGDQNISAFLKRTNVIKKSSAMKLIEQSGYPGESHQVQTEDGYLLTIHRIPYSHKSPSNHHGKPVVLLFHGLLSSTDSWLLRGPQQDLAYLLADNDYDVWLGNARGNVYSRRHIFLDPNRDKQFWQFSYHEIGYYDVPAIIDYILKKTKQKSLVYVGHSMGSTVFFIMCATRPEYNSKISLMHALAPAVYITKHKTSPLLKFLLSNGPALKKSCVEQNIYELFPLRKLTGRLGRALCHSASPAQPLCLAGVFMIAGFDYQLLDHSLLPKVFEHFPAGTSVQCIEHFYQNAITGFFRYFDYGEIENVKRYKASEPPEYNLEKVTTPVSLYYGDGDYIITRKDTEKLANNLTNLIGLFRVPFAFFNHLDFLWGSNSNTLLYSQILLITNKYQ